MNCEAFYDTVGIIGHSEFDIGRFSETLNYLHPNGSLLDVGCGEGYWMEMLGEKTNLQVVGCDVSSVRLQAARERLGNNGIRLDRADVCDGLPYSDSEFSQVTSLETLEHVPDFRGGLKELIRVASNRVLVSVPYNQSPVVEDCPECGSPSYMDGHINTLTENDFQDAVPDAKMSFGYLGLPVGLDYYVRKFVGNFFSNEKSSQTHSEKKSPIMVCPDCYHSFPLKAEWKWILRRVERLAKRLPEYLFVQIDLAD